eukprot:scaffold322548_cov18-Prasinocladus_malaysianus.AAC.1
MGGPGWLRYERYNYLMTVQKTAAKGQLLAPSMRAVNSPSVSEALQPYSMALSAFCVLQLQLLSYQTVCGTLVSISCKTNLDHIVSSKASLAMWVCAVTNLCVCGLDLSKIAVMLELCLSMADIARLTKSTPIGCM